MNINILELNLIIENNVFDITNLYNFMYISEEINEIPSMFITLQNTSNLLNSFNIQGGEKITIGLRDKLNTYSTSEWYIIDIKTEYTDESVDARFIYEGIVILECKPYWYILNQRINKTYHPINDDLCSTAMTNILKKYFFATDNEIDIEKDIKNKDLLILENPFNSLKTLSKFATPNSYTPYMILFRNINTISGNKKYIIKSFKTLYEENSTVTKRIAFSNNNKEKLLGFNENDNTFICIQSFIPEILKVNNKLNNHNLYKKTQSFNIETGEYDFYSNHELDVLDNSFIYDKYIDIDDTFFNDCIIMDENRNIDTSKVIIDEFINNQMKYNKVVINIVSKLSINIGDVVTFNNVENANDKYLLKNFMVSKVKHIFTRFESVTEVTLFGIDVSLQNFSNFNDNFGKVV